MDTHSLKEIADLLDTSIPRVQRASDRLDIATIDSPRGRRVTTADGERLRSHLGFVPATSDYSREEMLVLAALNRRPLGLRTARSVARVASVSPTTAARILPRLIELGLVLQHKQLLLEGEVIEGCTYQIDRTNQRWQEIAPLVRNVEIPHTSRRRSVPKRIPQRLWHLFWNAEPNRLDVGRDEGYIASRLLRSDDPQALGWAATHLSAPAINHVATLRGVTPRERRMLHGLALARQ